MMLAVVAESPTTFLDSKNSAFVTRGSAANEQLQIRETLATKVSAPSWLLYRYNKPAIILGAAQRPNEQQLARAVSQGVELVRRKSGGGAVMAGAEMLSVSVFLPRHHPISTGSTVKAYHWIGELWQKVFTSYRLCTRLPNAEDIAQSKQQAERHSIDWACYGAVAHGELLDQQGRKLLGVAQIRSRHGCVLTCGVYLYPPNWRLLANVVKDQPDQASILAPYNASVHCLAGADAESVIASLPRRIQDYLSNEFNDQTLDVML